MKLDAMTLCSVASLIGPRDAPSSHATNPARAGLIPQQHLTIRRRLWESLANLQSGPGLACPPGIGKARPAASIRGLSNASTRRIRGSRGREWTGLLPALHR